MKLNELLSNFSIMTSNEEKDVLKKCNQIQSIDNFSPRDQFVIEGLIRKSLVSKIVRNGNVLIVRNELQ